MLFHTFNVSCFVKMLFVVCGVEVIHFYTDVFGCGGVCKIVLSEVDAHVVNLAFIVGKEQNITAFDIVSAYYVNVFDNVVRRAVELNAVDSLVNLRNKSAAVGANSFLVGGIFIRCANPLRNLF